jgi:hypothetical protein
MSVFLRTLLLFPPWFSLFWGIVNEKETTLALCVRTFLRQVTAFSNFLKKFSNIVGTFP